jgi:transcriptional regulator with XRE-family HTH domain
MTTFGEYIHKLRGDKSMETVCSIAQISPSVLSRLESGERKDCKVSTLVGLAKALKTSEEKLIAVYKGKDPESVDDIEIALRPTVKDFIKHIPRKLLAEVIIEEKGEEKMRLLLEEAISRKKGKR